MKKIKAIEPRIADSEPGTIRNSMDQDQFEVLIVFMRSIRRMLFYILAVLFAFLCYVIEEQRHVFHFMILVYPVILIFIELVELNISRKILRKYFQGKSNPSNLK